MFPLPDGATAFRESDLVLLSDQPVGRDGQDDLLARSVPARQLARLIRDSRAAAPFVLAVYADWGMGKSSMLSQVKAEFDGDPDVKTVLFNAWTANRADALETLIKSVLGQLDPSVLRRLARRFSGESGLGAWTRVILRGAAGVFRLHHLVDDVWKQLSVDARVRNEARDQLSRTLREWTKGDGRTANGRMIVVFVDDLDRCPPDVIGVVCDAVKQYLSVPGLVFVLGCDQSIIESSVGAAGPAVGRRYLEKIVQASYSIPLPTDEDAAKLVEGYALLSGTRTLFQGAVAQAVTRHAGRNPRRIKRLINRFVIEYRLDPQWQQFGADALIRVILLQDLYPEFYALLARLEEADPIDEFLEYVKVRALAGSALAETDREDAERFFDAHGVPRQHLSETGVTDDLVARVEQELPREYVQNARDKTLVGLVVELAESAQDAAFRAKLRRRSFVAVAATSPQNAAAYERTDYKAATGVYDTLVPQSEPELSGLTILWIYNGPSVTGGFVERGGARIIWVENGDEAVRALVSGLKPDVVVSNLSRDHARDGGFDDLERVKSEGGYTGPLIVYTSFISYARQSRAAALGARITDRQTEFVSWLEELADPRSAQRPLRILLVSDAEPPALKELLERLADVVPVTGLPAALPVLEAGGIDAVVAHFRLYPPPAGVGDFIDTLRTVFSGPVLLHSGMDDSAVVVREALDHGGEVAQTRDAILLQVYSWILALGRAIKPEGAPRMDNGGWYRSDYNLLRRAAKEYLARGDIDRAEQRWETARDLAQAAGDAEAFLEAQVALGEISLRRRRHAKAISRLSRARSRWVAGYRPDEQVRMLNLLADAYESAGDTDRAADRRAEADRLDEARERFITRSDRRSGKPPESGAD